LTINDVMKQEREALLGESLIRDRLTGLTLLPYAAVTEPDVIVRTPSFIRSKHPVTIEPLSGRDGRTAFVQACASLRYKFLWVHADNDKYREDYAAFLRNVHNISGGLPANIHVDHLYNRERAKAFSAPFVRLALVTGPINTSHGAGYEKSRTGGIGKAGRDHKMDEITLMKLCGIPSPKKGQPLTADMKAHIYNVARLYGMSASEIEQNIQELMDVASFAPRG
jgi:hypothetical protein